MNASSRDAVIGVSSWTRRPSRAARSPICGAVSPSTVNDPPSPSPTLAPIAVSAGGERGHVGRDQLDGSAAAPGHEVGHAGLGDQPAPADHNQAVGGQRHLADQMAGHEHGPALRGQAPEEEADPADALRVEAVDRLVEQQHTWVAQQGRCYAEPLAHAERELPGPPVGDRASSPTWSRTSSTRRSGMSLVRASQRRWLRAVRAGWNAFASSRPPTSRRGQANSRIGLAADQGRPRVGVVEAHDHAHGRRLARAVRPQETGDHTGRDLEGQVVDSRRCAVALGE